MKTINRTAIYIGPKQPYVDWANSFDDGGPKLNPEDAHGVTFLIPDTYDETSFENWLKKNFKEIFQQELDSWMMDEEAQPKRLTYKLFNEWFDVKVSGLTFDAGRGVIETDEDY